MAHGDAALRSIDLNGQLDYAVIGFPPYLALRLCQEAQGGRILVSQSVWEVASTQIQIKPAGECSLDGELDRLPIFEVDQV